MKGCRHPESEHERNNPSPLGNRYCELPVHKRTKRNIAIYVLILKSLLYFLFRSCRVLVIHSAYFLVTHEYLQKYTVVGIHLVILLSHL